MNVSWSMRSDSRNHCEWVQKQLAEVREIGVGSGLGIRVGRGLGRMGGVKG